MQNVIVVDLGSDLENLRMERSPRRPLLERTWELRRGVTPTASRPTNGLRTSRVRCRIEVIDDPVMGGELHAASPQNPAP